MKGFKIIVCVVISLLSFELLAENSKNNPIYFTAPPRESTEKGIKTYQPIADFLTKNLNRKVIYKHPENWALYRRDMTQNKLDIVFDGPHFVSWRQKQFAHVPVAMLPQPHVWVIVKRKGNKKIASLKSIEGKLFCGQQYPNFGSLTAMTHFKTTREPSLIPLKGWKNVYKGVVSGKCVAGVLPITNLKKFDPKNKFIEIVHVHPAFPNQGFTVNNKYSPLLISKIQKLLLSKEGQTATKKLRERYSKGEFLIKPKINEYRKVSVVLNELYGFGFTFKD